MRRLRAKASISFAVLAGLGISARGNTYYVAPTGGSDSNPGTIGAPFATLSKGISTAVAGDTIYARGGTFNLTGQLTIGTSKNGTAANPFTLSAYPGETPILDFHSITSLSGSIRGVSLAASFWRISGLTLQYAPDNGVLIQGSNNIIQQVATRQGQDTGIAILGSASVHPANNLVLNCDSYANFDNATTGENADGFSAKERGLGTGNVFSGCRAWNNSDDGYDFWAAENGVVVQNCWAFHNGKATYFGNIAGFNGDGNGIKLGHDSGTHLLKNMLIWGNPANGIDVNGNATTYEGDPPMITHGVTIYNNTAYNNGGKNFNFDEDPTTATPPATHILRDNISVTGSVTVLAGNTFDHDAWAGGGLAAATTADFLSTTDPVTTDGLFHPATDRTGATTPTFGGGLAMGPRLADGGLPDLGNFLRLKDTSVLLNAGVDVGLPYIGTAPEPGALEFVPTGNVYWGVPSGGSLETSWNWISRVTPTAALATNFDLGPSSAYTVTFASSPTHAALNVRSGSLVTFSLNGNTYTVSGNAKVFAGASASIGGGTLNGGSMTIDGALNQTSGTIGVGAVDGAGTLNMIAGTFTANSLRNTSLSLGGGLTKVNANGTSTGTSKVTNLSVTGSAKLDLTNNRLIATGAAIGSWGGTAYTGVLGSVQSGRNGGGWNGNGIITSQSNAVTPNLPRTTLGVARGTQVKSSTATATATWSGQTITGTDTLVMYTYAGDSNLDGTLDVSDYGRIDVNIALPPESRTLAFANGDFNYDGVIDIGDYGLLDTNIALNPPPFSTGSGGGGLSLVAVPEPAGVLIVVLAPVAFLRRRRRR